MLNWIATLLVLVVVVGLIGAGVILPLYAGIARYLLVFFVPLLVIALLIGVLRGRG
ncbi:MAG TPA: hypothetical protein VMI52_02400 [Acetobacteraceae bacterium]|nr:hypothetical protein [Acetobacteraceae bacterium]